MVRHLFDLFLVERQIQALNATVARRGRSVAVLYHETALASLLLVLLVLLLLLLLLLRSYANSFSSTSFSRYLFSWDRSLCVFLITENAGEKTKDLVDGLLLTLGALSGLYGFLPQVLVGVLKMA